MKRTHTIASCVLLFFAALGLLRADGQSTKPPAPAKVVLSVEALMKNVDRHRGRIVTVEGVVSVIAAGDHTLGLIDVREFQACGLEGCTELTLPVRWTGTMPVVGQTVRADGGVSEADGKLVFAACALEKITPPRAKGRG